MIRRFALAPLVFLALWLVWFAVPITRGAARSSWQNVWSPPDAGAPSKPVRGTSRDALLARALSANDKRPAFVALAKRFPNDAAIGAGQLLFGASGLKLSSARQLGPASNPDRNWSVKLTKIERPSPAFLQEWLAASARGAKLEPNNTFWDWMRILGLLASRRDNEVWAVLKAAKSKTAFDDHTTDFQAALLRAQRQEPGPMSPLSEINLSAGNSFSIYGSMREAARQLSEDAYGLRLQNLPQSNRQALEGMRDFVWLSRTMRRESKWLIGSLVGQATESIGLWGGGYTSSIGKRGHPLPGAKSLPKYTSDSRSLLRFARAQKRGDIAAQLSGEWVALGTWRTKTRSAFLTTGMEGMNARDFTLASANDWLGWRLLEGMPFALGLIALSSLLLRFVPLLRRERGVVLSRASWAGGAALGGLSLLFLVSPMLWAVARYWKTGVSPWNIGFAMVYNSISLTASADSFSGAPREWGLAFSGAFLFVSALWLAASWNAKQRNQATLPARLKRLFHAPDDGLTRFDMSPVLGLIGILSALFVGTVGILAFLIVPVINSDLASMHDGAGWVLFGMTFVLALPALWRARSWASRAFALKLAQRFAWSFLISLSFLWGVLVLATAPAHRRFEAQLDRYLQVGEFQLARKRLGI
jgi:hypothetical protein